MIGPLSTRRRRLPLTPLIDVIFLLLLFFMLSSTFLRFSSVEVTASGAGRGAASREGQTALLKLRHDGTLSLNGVSLVREAMPAALAGLAAGGTTRLLLTAEHGGSVQDLVALLEVLEGGPLPVVLAAGGQR